MIFSFVIIPKLNAQDNRKYWSEGKLTWSDFQEKSSDAGVSELRFFFGYNTGKQKIGDTTISRIVSFCYIDKNTSWIHPDFKNEQYLEYNQVIFDLLELFRRKIQYELDRINSIKEAELKFQQIYNLCLSELEKYKNEAKQGQELNVINLWDYRVTEQLMLVNDNRIPGFTVRHFGYAANLALGSGFFTNSLGKYFSPTFNFTFGFDFAYKNSLIFINGTFAGDKVKKDLLTDNYWRSGQRANVAIIDISIGQAFINNSKIKLSPFFGLGITEFTGTTQSEPKSDLRIVDYNCILGVNLDYKLKTTISITPFELLALREKVETSIRIKFYMTRANYLPDLKGNSINMTVGINGFGNLIRLK